MTSKPANPSINSSSSVSTEAADTIRRGEAAEEHRPATRARRDWRDLRASILIGLCCFTVYNANFRSISAGDAYPARYLPFAIWKYQTLLLDPIEGITAQGRGRTAYWIVRLDDGRSISLYPVTLPVLIAPLYLPAAAYLYAQGWPEQEMDRVARVMEKVASSLLAALSASLLFLVLRRRAERGVALMLTLAFAFGTTTWMISSQALWQHGMGQLLVIGALLFLTAPPTARNALAAGLMCGLIAANRPPDVVIAAALGAYGLIWAGRRAVFLIGAASLPISLLLIYNVGVAGHLAGGYGLAGRAQFLHHDLLPGLAGLLFSPTRGLFVFSPFLLFLLLIWRHWPRDRGERILTLAMGGAIVLQLVLYAKADWRGGWAWGPRFLTDLLPLLIWMLVPVAAALRRASKVCFLIAIVISIAIEAVGAWCYTSVTDAPIFAVRSGPDQMRAAWDWRNAPFIAALEDGPAPQELAIHVRGSLDALQLNGRNISEVTAGEEVVAAGWALTGHESPVQVGVLIDGRRGPVSRTFYDRTDVRSALGNESSAGFLIPFDTAFLKPGNHRIAALAWNSLRGDVYYVGERMLTVLEAPGATGIGLRSSNEKENAPGAAHENLDRAFRTAAERVRDHQQDDGYWLTAFTTSTRFEQPAAEMNTFLTSFMIDMLDPIEGPAQMGETLRSARQHLTRQIEPSGLVRYHGLPDGPGIGTLGCAITPDTDDTALVWRIAPGRDRRQLTAALNTIAQYRTSEGLYRTWLARPEAYQCLNPGADPNPADIAIQMNLLLLLADARPAAGRALCKSLRAVVDEDRVWVYYRVTPIIAMVRLPDLEGAGCALELPEARMRTTVAEQEIWVSIVQLLLDAEKSPTRVDPDEIRAILDQLSADDFAMLRRNPPLLYHNDLTASVSRYYWSEDFGYALWLRLAHIHDQIHEKRESR